VTKRKSVKDAFNGEEYATTYYPYPVPQPPAYPVPQPPAYPVPQPPAYPAPDDMQAVRITMLSSHGATVARTAYLAGSTAIVTTGSAKREPGDDYDRETGRLLATSRALEVLAARLRRKANSRIRNAEAIRQHRAQVRKRDKLRELAGVEPAAKQGKRRS
jgi:hypothetical protein